MAYKPLILNDATDYDSIRYAARMDKVRLPDAAILSWAFLPAVEARLAKMVPTYAALTGTDATLLKSAAAKLTAAIALRSVPDSEKSLDYTYSQNSGKLADELEVQAAVDLSEIAVLAAALEEPDVASVQGPTRERAKTGGGWISESGVIT